MGLLLDSFWRAAAYCLHARVIVLSFLPLVILVALSLAFGYFIWDNALESVRAAMAATSLDSSLWRWLQDTSAIAPLIVIFAVTPVLVVLSLLLVAVLMMPALVDLVARRRFPGLERHQGASLLASLLWSLGSVLMAGLALVVTIPLWFVPPLILVLPPLIWGWLTYRVMAYDALAAHASAAERREIFARHRVFLLGIGVLCGYLGAAPSIVWASGALFAAAFVILVPVAIWIYTLVFAFASLWFAHYCLAALAQLRAEPPAEPPPASPAPLP